MIGTCKNHDSRVHNYRIHCMSLCILLKLSYMICGSISGGMSSKLFGQLMSFQQASSPFYNQNTFNLLDWLTFIVCWSLIKIFCQNKMLNIYWFQNNKETKTRNVSLKDEMWFQNKNATFHNNMIDNSSPFLNQLFWSYVILKMFRGQYSQWHSPSQNPLVSCSPTSRLASWNSCNCSIKMAEDPTMTSHFLSEVYHLENGGCMGFVGVRQKSGIWQMLVNKLTWQLFNWNSYNCSIEMIEDPTITSHLLSRLYPMANECLSLAKTLE